MSDLKNTEPDISSPTNPRWIRWTLVLLIVFSGLIRIPGLMYGFPEIVMRDEPTYAGVSLQMLRDGTLDPVEYRHGNFIHYFYMAIFSPFYYGSQWTGFYADGDSIPDWPFYLIARSLSLLVSLGALYLIYHLGSRLSHPIVGVLAAFLLACNPTFFRYGQLGKLDIYVLFLTLAAMTLFLRMKTRRDYWLAGVVTGIGASVKYSMIVLGPCIFLIFLWMRWRAKNKNQPPTSWRWLVESFAIAAVLIVLLNPFVLLNHNEAKKQIDRQYRITVQGQHVMAPTLPKLTPPVLFTRHLPKAFGWPLAITAIVGWIFWAYNDPRRWILVSLYPVIHYLMIFRWGFAFTRELLPVYPPLYLGAAALLYQIYSRLCPKNQTENTLALAPFLIVGFVVFSLYTPVNSIYEKQKVILAGNTKALAKQWIETNIPNDVRIARDAFALPMPKTHPDEVFSYTLGAHPYQYYVDLGVQYLVKTQLPKAALKANMEIAKNDRDIVKQAEKLAEWNPSQLGVEGPPLAVYRIPENVFSRNSGKT